MTAPTCFLIPAGEHWLWLAPLHGAAALVNDAAAHRLRRPVDKALPPELADLCQIAAEPASAPQSLVGPLVPRTLGILPTRGCNMHCVYCDFADSVATSTTMSEEVARAAIDWSAAACAGAGLDTLHVQFFGGEPFTARECVEFVVRHARATARATGLRCYIDASSNGLFNQEQCSWIGENLDAVVLSIDGPPRFQDRYRPVAQGRGSSAVVIRNAKALACMQVELCLRMCVSNESVHAMADNARWLMETVRPQALNFESLTASDLAGSVGLAAPDPYEFARQADRIFAVAAELSIHAVYAATESDAPRLSLCPVGRDVVIVSPDGRLSACYLMPNDWQRKGLDLDLGRIEPGRCDIVDGPALESVRALAADKPRCDACFCRYTCAGGCHVNLVGMNDHFGDYCVQTRLISATKVLRYLGFNDQASALLEDPAAMRRLTSWRDDRMSSIDYEAQVGAADIDHAAEKTKAPDARHASALSPF